MAAVERSEFRNIIAQMQTIRADVRERLDEISNSWWASDTYKLQQRTEAIEKAREQLHDLGDKADDVVAAYDGLIEAAERFSYTDDGLTKAVSLVREMKSKLPESAWRQMIRDYESRPAMLGFLADIFDENAVPDAAQEARDLAKAGATLLNLPRRIADELYYHSRREPDAEIDFSGVLSDIAQLDAIGDRLTAGTVEAAAEA